MLLLPSIDFVTSWTSPIVNKERKFSFDLTKRNISWQCDYELLMYRLTSSSGSDIFIIVGVAFGDKVTLSCLIGGSLRHMPSSAPSIRNLMGKGTLITVCKPFVNVFALNLPHVVLPHISFYAYTRINHSGLSRDKAFLGQM